MKWVLKYLSALRTRIAVGITVKVIGTIAELMIAPATAKVITVLMPLVIG